MTFMLLTQQRATRNCFCVMSKDQCLSTNGLDTDSWRDLPALKQEKNFTVIGSASSLLMERAYLVLLYTEVKPKPE
jgi:hypothetical protein